MDIIDSHFHIIGARDLRPDRAFAPPPFTVDRYLQLTDRMADAARWSRVAGGVVFGGSLQTREETLAEALEELELEAQSRGFAREDGRNFVGVITGTTELGSDRILALDTLYVNAVAQLILFGMYLDTELYFEAALIIAMLGFFGTVVLSKYVIRRDIVE